MPDESLIDRRASPRVPARFTVEWSDHYYEWTGECLNLGGGGCFVVGAPLESGKQVAARLQLPGQAVLEMPGKVAHVSSDGMGLAFSLPDSESFARAADAFERFVARDPNLAARARRPAQRLEATVRLYPTPRAFQAGAARTPDEKRVLRALGTGSRVVDLRARCGDAPGAGYAVFALLERDLVTLVEKRGARNVPAPWLEESAAPAQREGSRPPAAERYFQQARVEIEEGRQRAAVTSLRLALSLCPGDPQIEAELVRLGAKA